MGIGYQSMAHHESGNENVAVGGFSMANGKTGTANVAIGYEALEQCSGSFNVSVGGAESITTGEKNAVLGNEALALNETGSGNVAIGYHAGKQETGSNKLYIANTETATPLILGVFPNTSLQFNATEMGFFKHALTTQPAKPAETTKAIIEVLEKLGLCA